MNERYVEYILIVLSALLTAYCAFMALTQDVTLRLVMYQIAAIDFALVAIYLKPKDVS